MYGGTMKNNNQPGLIPTNGALPGAIYAAAAYNSLNNVAAFNRVFDNSLTMKFYDCDITNNGPVDIYAYGAWSQPLAILAGMNNHTNLYLNGAAAAAVVDAVASVPFEPAGTNKVNVYKN